MAITKEQVIRAAERIAERGERPTNPRIRAELGEGSYSTINAHMREWRAAQAEEQAPKPETQEPEAPEVPEELTAQAQKAAMALVTAAWRESDTRHAQAIEAERHALQAEFDKLRTERAQHDAEIEELNDALARLEQQGEEAVALEQTQTEAVRGELAQVQRQHADTREELAAVAATGKAARERVEELRQELEAARQQTAEAEQREREQREKANADARKMGDHVAEIMASLEQWKREAAAAKEAQAEAERRHEAELEEWRKELDAAEKAAAASDATQRAATDAVTQLKERVEGLEARLADAQGVIERLTAREQRQEAEGPGSQDDQPGLPFDRG